MGIHDIVTVIFWLITLGFILTILIVGVKREKKKMIKWKRFHK